MFSSLQQKPESTKKVLAVLCALVVTVGVGAIWIVTFDSRGLQSGAEGAKESFRQLGVGVQNQIDIYKTQTQATNLDSPTKYEATEEESLPASEADSSFGPDDSGVVQAQETQLDSENISEDEYLPSLDGTESSQSVESSTR